MSADTNFDTDPKGAKIDIVFAHGFYGRGSTWTGNKTQGLVEDIQHARILNIECDATMDLSTQVSPEMTDTYVRELATRLTDKRLGPQMDKRPIVFVADAVGGLVCAQLALGDCRLKDDNIGSIAACTRGILFLGTPFQGAFMADPIPDRGEKICVYVDPVDISRFGSKGDEGCKKIATTLQKIVGDVIRDDPKKPEGVRFENKDSKIVNQGYQMTISSQTNTL